jgi:small-conductance mechanosensitive channel
MTEFDALIDGLSQPAVLWEVGVVLSSLALAYGLCWFAGRRSEPDSVWFGRGIVDGLLFPVLSLLLVYGGALALGHGKAVLLFKVAIPVLLSLAGLRLIARVLTVVFPASGAARLVERLFSWVVWLCAVAWITGLWPPVAEELDAIHLSFGKSKVSLLNLGEGLLSSGLVLVLALWVSAVLERRVLRQAVNDLSLRKVAANTIRAALLVLGLFLALSAVGVDLTALSVLGGALGVGLGFGLQKLAANYVSGFVILFERSLRIGDTVRVDNFEGQVVDIKTRYTLIRAPNGRESIVPNEKVITERVENLSLADSLVLQMSEVTVGYDSDVAQVQRILIDASLSVPRVQREPAPAARLERLGPDGLEFQLSYWIDDPSHGQPAVRSDVHIAMLHGLRAAGIDIPFPQRVVRLERAPSRASKPDVPLL